jgi:hypothetical protein
MAINTPRTGRDKRRRFPPPYSVTDEGHAWLVRDANGFKIVWFSYDARARGGDTAVSLLTREEAYAFAVNFARLPALILGRAGGGPP